MYAYLLFICMSSYFHASTTDPGVSQSYPHAKMTYSQPRRSCLATSIRSP